MPAAAGVGQAKISRRACAAGSGSETGLGDGARGRGGGRAAPPRQPGAGGEVQHRSAGLAPDASRAQRRTGSPSRRAGAWDRPDRPAAHDAPHGARPRPAPSRRRSPGPPWRGRRGPSARGPRGWRTMSPSDGSSDGRCATALRVLYSPYPTPSDRGGPVASPPTYRGVRKPPRSYQRNARPSTRVLMATTQLPTTRTPICAHIGRRLLTAAVQ